MFSKKRFLLLAFLLCTGYVSHCQDESYFVFFSEGDVTGFGKVSHLPLKAKQRLDTLRFIQIGAKSTLILVNQDAVPCKLDREGIYLVDNLKKYFKSDPIAAKYVRFIVEEIELKPHNRYTPHLNIVSATSRGEEDNKYPQMLCPFDNTILTSDSVVFSWTDPMKKGTFIFLLYDYQDSAKNMLREWKMVLKEEVSATYIKINISDLCLDPGKNYAWIVDYSDPPARKRVWNVIKIPEEKWLGEFSEGLKTRENNCTDLYDQLELAIFLLDNYQMCDARSAFMNVASGNEDDELIRKLKMFFSY